MTGDPGAHPPFDSEQVIRIAVDISRLAALAELGQQDISQDVTARIGELLAQHGPAALMHAARVWSMAIAETLTLSDVAGDGTAFALFDMNSGERISPDDARLDPAFVWALRFHAACVNSDRDAAIAWFAAMLDREYRGGELAGDGLRWLVRLAGRADSVRIQITAARGLADVLGESYGAARPGQECPAEPPPFSIVTDRDGVAWQRRALTGTAGREWVPAGDDQALNWEELTLHGGPILLHTLA